MLYFVRNRAKCGIIPGSMLPMLRELKFPLPVRPPTRPKKPFMAPPGGKCGMVCGLVRHHCHCCAAGVGHVLAGSTCAWRLPGQHGPWPAGALRGHTLRLSARPIPTPFHLSSGAGQLPRISKTGKRDQSKRGAEKNTCAVSSCACGGEHRREDVKVSSEEDVHKWSQMFWPKK